MRYLSYNEYRDFGGKAEVMDFMRYIFKAEKTVDIYTFQRLVDAPTVSATVKACLRELVDYLRASDDAGADGQKISAMSNDGVSVTYAAVPTETDKQFKAYTIIAEYLTGEKDGNGTPLLYRGV
jgi:hypothetical protein